MKAHRAARRAAAGEPWQAIAARLEREYPERWGLPAPRVVARISDVDDGLLIEARWSCDERERWDGGWE